MIFWRFTVSQISVISTEQDYTYDDNSETGWEINFCQLFDQPKRPVALVREPSTCTSRAVGIVSKLLFPHCKIIRSSYLAVRQLSMQGLKLFCPDTDRTAAWRIYPQVDLWEHIPSKITTTTRIEDWPSLKCLIENEYRITCYFSSSICNLRNKLIGSLPVQRRKARIGSLVCL